MRPTTTRRAPTFCSSSWHRWSSGRLPPHLRPSPPEGHAVLLWPVCPRQQGGLPRLPSGRHLDDPLIGILVGLPNFGYAITGTFRAGKPLKVSSPDAHFHLGYKSWTPPLQVAWKGWNIPSHSVQALTS